MARALCVAALWLLRLHGACAVEWPALDGCDVRLNTTVQTSLAARVSAANPGLLANINGDDGDRAFNRGLISTRLDVTSELTIERGDLGLDISARGFYDPQYLRHSADASQQSYNPLYGAADSHPDKVRAELGRNVELLNAFIRDRISLDDIPVTLRVGRQAVLWGESLFFANNGIAAGQAPIDAVRALADPLAPARDIYLPVGQAWLRAQLRPGLALEAYDQFEWRRDQLPGVTSYFSTDDTLDIGGQSVLLPGGGVLTRSADAAPHGLGQFGAALRLQQDDADFGLYALRYDAKLPQPIYNYIEDSYRLRFPTGIYMLGASASTYLASSTIAGEISLRARMPLASGGGGPAGGSTPVLSGGGGYSFAGLPGLAPAPAYAGPPVTGFARGESVQAQISQETQLPPARFWQGATLQSEFASNDLLRVTSGSNVIAPGRTHFAASLRTVFTPQYYNVLPGLDINLPIGLAYTPLGRSSIDASQNAGTGSATFSVSATYHTMWQAALSYTHFIGGAGAQPLADRDFVILSVRRSF